MRDENPRLVQEHQLHGAKITLWWGIHANGVLDPYYFDNQTVSGADYYELLNTYVESSRNSFPQNYLFQQDGEPRTQVMLSVLFLTHYFLILGSEIMALKTGPQDQLIYRLLNFYYGDLLRMKY